MIFRIESNLHFKFLLYFYKTVIKKQYIMLLRNPITAFYALNFIQNQVLELSFERLMYSLLPDNRNYATY